jgi:hypothetical protein
MRLEYNLREEKTSQRSELESFTIGRIEDDMSMSICIHAYSSEIRRSGTFVGKNVG